MTLGPDSLDRTPGSKSVAPEPVRPGQSAETASPRPHDAEGSPDSVSSDLTAALRAVDYPANKDRLVEAARRLNLDPITIDVLDSLPEQDFQSPDEVTQSLSR